MTHQGISHHFPNPVLDPKLESVFKTTPLVKLGCFKGVNLWVKKDYLNHPFIQGNKRHKLKYNLLTARLQNKQGFITFGGAHSNHILACAAAAQLLDLPCIGIIRGDELVLKSRWSETLIQAAKLGMAFHFVSRSAYREKEKNKEISQFIESHPNYYVIPEGGSNHLAVKGVAEMVKELINQSPVPIDCFLSACGTGGTMAGLLQGFSLYSPQTQLIGVPVLKGATFLIDDISVWVDKSVVKGIDWTLWLNYHHGGYAKVSDALLDFKADFEAQHHLPLDNVYTAKLFFAVMDNLETFKQGANVVIYHSGGIQTAL